MQPTKYLGSLRLTPIIYLFVCDCAWHDLLDVLNHHVLEGDVKVVTTTSSFYFRGARGCFHPHPPWPWPWQLAFVYLICCCLSLDLDLPPLKFVTIRLPPLEQNPEINLDQSEGLS